MIQERIRALNKSMIRRGPIVYWMSRDQRVADNWALLHAQELALQKQEPLAVVFCLVPSFLDATIRQYDFMLKGLEEVEKSLEEKNVPFFLLTGSPEDAVVDFVERFNVSILVSDFDPLRIKRGWKKAVGKKILIPFYEVDAHNIVSCYAASSKQEYSAHALRLKYRNLFSNFLEDFPAFRRHPVQWKGRKGRIAWKKIANDLKVDRSVPKVSWIMPGEEAARKSLERFLLKRLPAYDRRRNDPSQEGQSDLSPYLHFGQLSAQHVALRVQRSKASKKAKDAFLEELVVRRELADNFCLYNANYDSFEGFPDWAQKSLNEHRKDEREHCYSLDQFERARTHDELWNAAQEEMVKKGKMHGYMRMYWCKKIMEWSESPEEAMRIAIRLNDRYELDGRDPNGYAGIAWSIGGVHDRAWPSRPVYGKIRSMTYEGCKRKFDVQVYIEKVRKS